MGSLSLDLFGFCIFTFALLGPLGHRISEVDSHRTTKMFLISLADTIACHKVIFFNCRSPLKCIRKSKVNYEN